MLRDKIDSLQVYLGPILSKSNKETPTLTWKTKLSNLNKATPKRSRNSYFDSKNKLSKLNKATTTLTWTRNISKIKQLQIKIVTRLKILGVSKVSQPLESKFSTVKIKFPMFVVEAPTSILHN